MRVLSMSNKFKHRLSTGLNRAAWVRIPVLVSAALWACAGAPIAAAQDPPDALPDAAYLTDIVHEYQTWNNCAPATLAMALSYWGWTGTQEDTAAVLKPNWEDKNVGPAEMAEFVHNEVPDLRAIYRYAGSIDLLKRLVAAGFPVVIETGFAPEGEEWMGHYRLVVGYSEVEMNLVTFDSYQGVGIPLFYDEADIWWQHFNRAYVVIYRSGQEEQVAGILGDDWDPVLNTQRAVGVAQAETEADPNNAFAWFNLGTSYALNGQYPEAADAYDRAFSIGLPWRMLWYQFGPLEAYLHVDRLDDTVALAESVLAHTPHVEEIYYYYGMVHAARGEREAASDRFRQALEYNPNFTPAQRALCAPDSLC